MERRTLQRQTINYPVWVICIDAKEDLDDQCIAYALDISESGMLIESPADIRGTNNKNFGLCIREKNH